jgi:hypothetical protein
MLPAEVEVTHFYGNDRPECVFEGELPVAEGATEAGLCCFLVNRGHVVLQIAPMPRRNITSVEIRFRIQGLDDQKIKKLQLKFFYIFLTKIAKHLSLGLLKGRPSYRRSLQPSKEKLNLSTFL